MPRMRDAHLAALVTRSFASQFREELRPELQAATCAKFIEMAERFVSQPTKLGQWYDRVEYLNKHVYELDINRSWRGIVKVREDGLALYCVGDHDMIVRRRFTPQDLMKADNEPTAPLSEVVCASVFQAATSSHGLSHVDALDDHWFFRLDREQHSIVEELIAPIDDPSRQPIHALVTGGPGTGKTTILTQLADYCDWDPSVVALAVSERVADLLAASSNNRVYRCRVERGQVYGSRAPVVLVDDPVSWKAVEWTFNSTQYVGARLVVIAADLAQVEAVVSDRDVRVYLGGRGIRHFELKRCYRQTKTVGAKSMEFLRFISTRFTKFVSPENKARFDRTHSLSVESADAMTYVVPGGYSRVHEQATLDHIRAEVEHIKSLELWKQWHPLGIIIEKGIKGSRVIRELAARVNGDVIDFEDTDRIRGLEYQHVFVVITRSTLHRLTVTGRSGLSTDDYIAARNMRVPFSRAVEGFVVFGMEA